MYVATNQEQPRCKKVQGQLETAVSVASYVWLQDIEAKRLEVAS